MNQIAINLIVGASLLLSFLVFMNPNKHNKPGNKWLSVFIFCLFLLNIDEFLLFNSLDKGNFQFYVFSLFFISPVFYFTVFYFVNPTKKWNNWNFLHFVAGLFFIFFLQNTVHINESHFDVKPQNLSPILQYISLFFVYVVLPSQIVYYVCSAYLILQKHKKNVDKFSANTTEIDLKWLEKIVFSIIVLSLLFLIDLATKSVSLLNWFFLFGLFFIGYFALKQKEIYSFPKSQKKEIIAILEDENADENKKRKLLSDEKLLKIKHNLIRTIETEKPFLNSDITLILLANQLDISTHLLSYVINAGFNENFNQFINRYRIEEAKKLILDSTKNHLSILGIGYEVGFNSKSVFNSTFKKNTGLTPIQFKNENLVKKIGTEL